MRQYLIENIIKNNMICVVYDLIVVALKLGYTKQDILDTYWSKWQKNMDRIGKE